MPEHPSSGLPRRRQNKSCDQCRDGKRRCDVQVTTQHGGSAQAFGFGRNDGHKTQYLPCTNCTRWKKRCTVEWIKSRAKRTSPGPPIQERGKAYPLTANDVFGHRFDIPTTSDQVDLGYQLNDCLIQPTVFENGFNFSRPALYPDSSFESSESYASQSDSAENLYCQQPGSYGQLIAHLDNSTTRSVGNGGQAIEYHEGTGHDMSHSSIFGDLDDETPESNDCSFPRTERSQSARHLGVDGRVRQSSATSSHRQVFEFRATSPFSSHLLAEDYNRVSIKKGLLKIYHDSMEGALSCWLTERNCPYSSTVFDGKDVWSSNWANRIVTRVCDLDRVYASTGAVCIKDQEQASKVLNLVVMAFAAQWSQTGERGNSRLPTFSTSLPSGPSAESSTHNVPSSQQLQDDPFGREMQNSLWRQANKALCEASDNSSFRVIFAGIIFSLAQRPVNSAEVLGNLDAGQRSSLASLFQILDLDGAPICLDVALRKLLDHQRRLEDDRYAAPEGTLKPRAALKLPGVHRETFGLLCWLAVMFDTLSAAVNRRSFTVCDKDSNFSSSDPSAEVAAPLDDLTIDLDGWSDFSGGTSHPHCSEVNIWGDYFLHAQSQVGDLRKQYTRWPCSYDDAASCLADAAPVKVLLFRRVAHLQDLSYRRSSADEVEIALETAMEVYTHWNNTYGRFIDDCVRHHEELPARIQSWYLLLAGHWNLAVLILSDVIQKLDDAHRSQPRNCRSRESIEFTKMLRTRAAFAVSDLGRCCRYGDEDLTFSQSPDFHHAVNKAALLTEPWTTVLVRSFGYAGAFFARQILSQPASALLVDTDEARERLQYCIDALWLLGKKSDMAMCAAQVLRQAVE